MFHSIASSSRGNAHVVTEGNASVLIDAGVPKPVLMQHFNGALNRIKVCLLTHEHQDHAKSISVIWKSGISIIALPETLESVGVPERFAIPIDGRLKHDDWAFTSIRLDHNVPCAGFVIDTPLGERIAVFTDTRSIPGVVKNVSVLAIEANHDVDLVRASSEEYSTIALRNHMSIDTAVAYAKAFQARSTRLREIHLLHLSGGHSDEEGFKRRMIGATGLPVIVAAG